MSKLTIISDKEMISLRKILKDIEIPIPEHERLRKQL